MEAIAFWFAVIILGFHHIKSSIVNILLVLCLYVFLKRFLSSVVFRLMDTRFSISPCKYKKKDKKKIDMNKV